MDLTYKKQLAEFFNCNYERSFDEKILSGNFIDHKEVVAYILHVVNIPISEFIEYISSFGKTQAIMASDVFQFSDFDDATTDLCSALESIGNPGVKFKQVAQLLLTDNVQRNDVALSKYGENHIKTAECLGLAFKDASKNYYLSAVGCVFNDLKPEEKEKLLIRLILRYKLFTQLLMAALQGEFELEVFLYDLSKSTYLRRRTNINRVIEILNNSTEYNFSNITKNINY